MNSSKSQLPEFISKCRRESLHRDGSRILCSGEAKVSSDVGLSRLIVHSDRIYEHLGHGGVGISVECSEREGKVCRSCVDIVAGNAALKLDRKCVTSRMLGLFVRSYTSIMQFLRQYRAGFGFD